MDSDIQSHSNNIDLANIKSNYILKIIFNNLKKNKLFKLIKLNKNIQKRLDININDYKGYSDIEIELIPISITSNIAKFINILPEEKLHYYIYFDDSTEETDRTYIKKEDNVKKIRIIIKKEIDSFLSLFEKCRCIESIIFKKFNRNNITSMRDMFLECSSLKSLDLTNFNTNNVTNMSYMFAECSSLEKLNLLSFNTDNVTNMIGMFYGCYSLKELNIPYFNITKNTLTGAMFSKCSYNLKMKIQALKKDIAKEAFN